MEDGEISRFWWSSIAERSWVFFFFVYVVCDRLKNRRGIRRSIQKLAVWASSVKCGISMKCFESIWVADRASFGSPCFRSEWVQIDFEKIWATRNSKLIRAFTNLIKHECFNEAFWKYFLEEGWKGCRTMVRMIIPLEHQITPLNSAVFPNT
jgi:hypothetical protein